MLADWRRRENEFPAATLRRMISRLGRGLVAALPLALGLAFAPWVDPPFSAPKAALLMVFTGALTALAICSRAQPPATARNLWIAWAAWMSVCMVSAAASSLRYMTPPAVVWVAAGGALVWAAAHFIDEHSACLSTIALAGALAGLAALAQFTLQIDFFAAAGLQSSAAGRMQAYGTIGNPDWVAVFLAACAPAALALMWQRRMLGTPALVVMIAGVAVTGSRAGMLALAIAGTLTIALLSAKHARLLALVIVAAAVLLVVRTPANPRNLREAMAGRMFVWQTALVKWRPLLGSGPGTFAYLYPLRLGTVVSRADDPRIRFAGNESHALNDGVEAASDTGIFGALALGAVFIAWYSLALRQPRPALIAPAVGGVSAIVAASFVDFPLHRPESWGLLCLWMAAALPKCEAAKPMLRARSVLAAGIFAIGCWFGVAQLMGAALTGRGRILEWRQEAASAERLYRRALAWDRGEGNAHFGLVRALAKQARYPEAVREADDLVRWVNEPECWLLRSRILRADGKDAEARQTVEAALHLFPYSAALREESRELAEPGR